MEPSPQKLSECLAVLPAIQSISGNDQEVFYSGISFDSRTIKPGDIYVALRGINTDGHQYIKTAIQNGASAVIGEEPFPDPFTVPYIRVADSREAMGYAAAALYRFPSKELVIIGVTGTDGKTTTSTLIYEILRQQGLKTGLISTVSAVIDEQEIDTGFHVTTPESLDIQKYLAMMKEAGVTHVICETTSHGLAQKRVAAIHFDISVLTNITHEHIDYHKTSEAYFAAKSSLFEMLGKGTQTISPLVILNYDNPESYNFVRERISVPYISYSASGEDEIPVCSLIKMETDSHGMRADVKLKLPGTHEPFQMIRIETSLIGSYNLSNILAAVTATVFGLGISPQVAAQGVHNMKSIPGRMQLIDCGQNFTAIVDFAHTPNALSVALDSARELLPAKSQGRVIAVYGSAGLRDRQKRRMMPAISAEKADITIITAEDPRTESLDAILKEMADEAILYGARMGETLFTIPDRGDAIRFALSLATPDDLVISCGKGHEQSMCFGEKEYLWDDRTAMRAALCELLQIPGPEMPYLPTAKKKN